MSGTGAGPEAAASEAYFCGEKMEPSARGDRWTAGAELG